MSLNKRVVIASATSVVLIAGVVIATLTFGIVEVPKYQTFAESPLDGARGTIAYVQSKEDSSESCLFVVELPNTEADEIFCSTTLSFVWLNDGRLAVSDDEEYGYHEGETATAALYDPSTGDKVGNLEVGEEINELEITDSIESSGNETPNGSLQTDYERARVRDEDGEVLLDLGGPLDYLINSAQYSPDKQWMVLADSEGRILVSDPKGEEVRTLVETPRDEEDDESYYFGSGYGSGTGVSWYQPGEKGNSVFAEELSESGFSEPLTRFGSQQYYGNDEEF